MPVSNDKKAIGRPDATTAIIGYEPDDCQILVTTAVAFRRDINVGNFALTDEGRENVLGLLRQELVDPHGHESIYLMLVFPEQAAGLIAQMEVLLEVQGGYNDQFRASVNEAKTKLLRNYARWTN
jgi:hypothetical protein